MYDGERTGFISGERSSPSASVTPAIFEREVRTEAELVDVVDQVDLFPAVP
jgi:hypothetical protein